MFALSPLKNHIDLAYGMVDEWIATADSETAAKWSNSDKSLDDLVGVLQIMPVDIFAANMKEAASIGRVFQEKYSPTIEGE